MLKSIDELQEEAEYLQIAINATTEDVNYHKGEALKSAALIVGYRQELDAVERALIAATGEAS